jgi:tripartite-type tricarboxylate transporter receptor subunit TctC
MMAPTGVSKEIIGKLHSAMTSVLKAPAIAEKLSGDGTLPVGNTPDEFARFLRVETDKWAKVVRAAGITPR